MDATGTSSGSRPPSISGPWRAMVEGARRDAPGRSYRGPLAGALQVDAACDRFEKAWRQGRAPRVEDYLEGQPAAVRGVLLYELLVLELELRRDEGDHPGLSDYLARFPGEAEAVARAFGDPAAAAATAPAQAQAPAGGGPLGPWGEAGSTESGADSWPQFGDYQLLEEVGRGGMGVIYRARQVGLNRIVALKMILSGRFASQAETRRFRTEAEAAANLDHPHIVPIYEVGSHQGYSYYSMRYVAGGNLATHVARYVGNPRAAARLLLTIARAVDFAHRRGLVHRDLKPSNILLDDDDRPLVADFGLAKWVETGSFTSHAGGLIGTPAYMAPEQAAGESISAAADLYSLGAILYQLLTGRAPFRGQTVAETLAQVLERDPIPPRLLRPEIPVDLELICLKCLEKQPRARYASAAVLADDLDRFLRDEAIQSATTGLGERLRRWTRREPETASRLFGQTAVVVLTQVNYQLHFPGNRSYHATSLATRSSSCRIIGGSGNRPQAA